MNEKDIELDYDKAAEILSKFLSEDSAFAVKKNPITNDYVLIQVNCYGNAVFNLKEDIVK